MTREEAIKKIKAWDFLDKDEKKAIETLIPELAESGDKKIRKFIIEQLLKIRETVVYNSNLDRELANAIAWLEKQGEKKSTLPKWKYKKDHTPLLRDSIILNKYGGVAKSPSGAIVSDVWVLDYGELAKLPKEEIEKQGEQKHVDKVEPKFNVGDTMRTLQEANNGYTDGMPVVVSIDNEYYHCTNELIAIKDQDNYEFPPINVKQKIADNTEPKFHEGDWLISNNKKSIYQVIEVKRGIYVIRDNADNHKYHIGIEQCEKSGRLWNISDAKNGDVLFSDLMNGKTFIYNGVNPDMAILYSFIISNDGEDVLPYHIGKPNTGIGNIEENKNIIHPATKEQRDLLFQKMKEAGWKWDEEKKELRKIEQPELTEFEDAVKDMMNAYRDAIGDNDVTTEEVKKHATYLLSLISHKSTEWSEEDENRMKKVMHILSLDGRISNEELNSIYDWLKTLKSQKSVGWSEDDERNTLYISAALQCYYRLREDRNNINGQENLDKAINWLYNKLKFLRPQPKQEWSEEDEELCQDCLDVFEALGNGLEPLEDYHKLYDWLIRIKQREQQ